MADSIRPTSIGFAFGAVAGVLIGAWYAGGMATLDAQEAARVAEAKHTDAVQRADAAEEQLRLAEEDLKKLDASRTELAACEARLPATAPKPGE